MNTSFSIDPYLQSLWDIITIEFMIKFIIIYFFIVWIALVIWVGKDISHRSSNRLFQFICVLIMILLTPFGVFLYLIIRPGKSVYEKFTEEIEENLGVLHEMVQEKISSKKGKHILCPGCDEEIERDFIICPYCHLSLKKQCSTCKKDIQTTWDICPYCEEDQTQATKTSKKQPQKKKTTNKTEKKSA